MEIVVDVLLISLIVILLIIGYQKFIKVLSKNQINREDFCVLYSTETYQVNGEVEFYFQCPRPMQVDFKIWSSEDEESVLASKEYAKGGHIIRYDTNILKNGVYTFGIETPDQKTIKKFKIKN
jgi:hypothetical protein